MALTEATYRVPGTETTKRRDDHAPSPRTTPAANTLRPIAATEPTFEVVTDEAAFLALEPEWKTLWAQLREPRFSQSFDWFRVGWETTGRPRGRSLFIVVMRVDGRAVLIWPLGDPQQAEALEGRRAARSRVDGV